MPKITQSGNRGKITWDSEDWLGGLHPQPSTTTAYRRLTNTLAICRSVNPYRVYGSLSPAYNPTNATNVSVVDSAVTSVAVNGSKAYMMAGVKIQELTISTTTITTPTNFPYTIPDATVGGEVIIYNVSGVTKLFYSWYDGTDGDVGISDFAATFDPDFMSTVPTGAAVLVKGTPLPMIVGDDDLLYIGNGNLLKSYDGSTDTFNGTVLDLPDNFIITSFAKISPFSLVIFGYTSTSGTTYNLGGAKAYFWDYLSETYDKIVELEDNFVQAAFNWSGTIGCFTQGRPSDKATGNKFSRLQLYDGARFVPIVDFVGNIPSNDGVDILGSMIQWNSQGVIYSWGDPFNSGSKILIKIGEGSGTTAGILKTLSSTKQVMSSGATTSGGLQSLNSNYYHSSLLSPVAAEPEFGDGFKNKITKVRIKYNKAFTGGRGISLILRSKAGDLNTIINQEKVQTKTVKEYTQDTSEKQLKEFFDIYPVFTWDSGDGATVAPLVDTLEVFYKRKKISI